MGDLSAVAGAAKSIGSTLVTEAKYLYGVEDTVRDLQRELECMHQFLQNVDANPNLLKQDGQLCILTRNMRELAFRAEDSIDTYLVDIGSKAHNNNFLLKFVCLIPHSYPMHMLRKEIEAIKQDIKDAMTRSDKFRASFSVIGQSQGACVGSNYSKHVAENYIHLDDEFVVGIGEDISRLVKRLTNPLDDFQVLGIVGTGGAGKTTLASQIYRQTKVQSSFSHRAFVSISQQWSRLDLLHRISKKILGQSEIPSDERELVRVLHDFMKDKRCLVVLDDIWKKEAWDCIYSFFPRTKGLRVILTTRIEEVPLYADKNCVLHQPKMLTSDQMWELFSRGAVKGRHGIENNVEFEKLGKLMLKKCHGLPLAVVTLVGILRTKMLLHEWEAVSEDLSGKILTGTGGSTYGVVEQMIELSYLDLPAHLKPLFLYLAVIQEDGVWSSERMIEMWIAEGFVADDQTCRSKTLEDKGMQFMSELDRRYIIQVKSRNHRDEVDHFCVHDLMREFCIKKANECQFFENISSTYSHHGRRRNKPRRISIFLREHCLEENNHLRTIVYQGLPQWSSGNGIIMKLNKLESIHKDFKLLRVLRIAWCANETLPQKIGNLIHLTYLCIISTEIAELPESVRNLHNLIHLEFLPRLTRGRTAKVPDDLVVNMENLRVLQLPTRLQKRGFSNCKRLGLSSEKHKKICKFKCSAGSWMEKEFPVMYALPLRYLDISNIDEIEEMEAINHCLGLLTGSLQTFYCRFSGEGVSKELKFDTEKLIGCPSLHNLYLDGRLVNSCTILFPANVVRLYLSGSEIEEGVDLMGVLGQLSKLKFLYIHSNAYLGTRLCCAYASFPQLEKLTLGGLFSLEEWRVEGGAMSRLKKIEIYHCQELKRLPRRIRSITTLKELEIASMPEEFCWRLGYKRDENRGPTSVVQTKEGKDSYIIEHIPSVKVLNILSKRR